MVRVTARIVVRDALIIGFAGFLPWLGYFLAVWIYGELFVRDFWMDRADILGELSMMMLYSAVAGTSLGLLSSLPVRVPRNGFRFVPCCLFIASVAAAVRLLSSPDRLPKAELAREVYEAKNAASLLMTVAAAFIASSGLTTIAVFRSGNRVVSE